MSLPAPSALPTVALTIAGSDSGGGAGIAADLETFAALGVFGTVAITAITAQNTEKVTAIQVLPTDIVEAQLEAVIDDLPVQSTKSGMLASEETVELVADWARAGRLPLLVVDPVIVATAGALLLDPGARSALLRLVASAHIVTPNVPEAEVLLQRQITDVAAMHEAARALCDLGTEVAVVKGGHLHTPDAVDVICVAGETTELRAPRIDTANTHGTGCTLSAAICANLALGRGDLEAISAAKSFVHDAIARSREWHLGAGPGPIDHLGRL